VCGDRLLALSDDLRGIAFVIVDIYYPNEVRHLHTTSMRPQTPARSGKISSAEVLV